MKGIGLVGKDDHTPEPLKSSSPVLHGTRLDELPTVSPGVS